MFREQGPVPEEMFKMDPDGDVGQAGESDGEEQPDMLERLKESDPESIRELNALIGEEEGVDGPGSGDDQVSEKAVVETLALVGTVAVAVTQIIKAGRTLAEFVSWLREEHKKPNREDIGVHAKVFLEKSEKDDLEMSGDAD